MGESIVRIGHCAGRAAFGAGCGWPCFIWDEVCVSSGPFTGIPSGGSNRAAQILEPLGKKVYIRYPFGLRPVEKREDVPKQEKPTLAWLDTSVYDVTDSGGQAAWYDWKEDKIYLGSVEGEIQDSFDVSYECKELAFSPDGRYLLNYEIEYGGEITDDEYCYYRVIDLKEGTQYTVYSGYREWLDAYWEED